MLPPRGVLLASTDVHGDLRDFAALEAVIRDELAAEPESHWVILGDVVHAPDARARADRPDLYDFDDGSMAIVDAILRLRSEHPGRVHFVLGNHDHGHVGGPHTRKFHDDEVDALERCLTEGERRRMHGLFASALLAVAAPCGVLLCHGSPDDALVSLRALDDVPLELGALSPDQARVLQTILTSYGQPDATCRRMLEGLSRELGFPLSVVVHGHDRDEAGWFREGAHQVCPVLFGAPRAQKRYVRLDLRARYPGAAALRDGIEIRRLFPR